MVRVDVFKEWFDKAQKDLAEARALRSSGAVYEASAFMCHQAVEKALTGYLIAVGHPVSSHDLVLLGRSMEVDFPELGELKLELGLVNRYYLEMTYPDDLQYEVSAVLVDRCIAIAEQVLNIVSSIRGI